jgi:hypothetical protein
MMKSLVVICTKQIKVIMILHVVERIPLLVKGDQVNGISQVQQKLDGQFFAEHRRSKLTSCRTSRSVDAPATM